MLGKLTIKYVTPTTLKYVTPTLSKLSQSRLKAPEIQHLDEMFSVSNNTPVQFYKSLILMYLYNINILLYLKPK